MMRPVSEVQERETRIIKLATELHLSQTDLDEAVVDAEFLFRFDSACCKWVDNIRGMMWAMIGQVNKRPLPSEEGERLYLHLLENNPDVSVGVQLKQNRQVLTISTAKGDYRCFAQRLREELEQALGRLGEIQNNVAEFETECVKHCETTLGII